MTFTKEQLIEKLQHRISVASGFPGSEKAQMDLELALIALASLEADSVANSGSEAVLFEYTGSGNFYGYGFYRDGVEVDVDITEPLYTAPPAPVSVPAGYRLQPISEYDAMCAAMLQGAEPVKTGLTLREGLAAIRNSGIAIDAEKIQAERDALNSPSIPDGWVACSERMPEQFVEVLVCTEDGGRYVAALNRRMNWDDGDFFDDIQYVTHWMPLPAAPQQEVK